MVNSEFIMSRIGKKPIIIPAGVDVAIDGGRVSVKGPKGELSREFGHDVLITMEDGMLLVAVANESKIARSMWGTVRMHLANMVEGTVNNFSKQLQVEGIGYRAAIEGGNLVLNIGFTHPVKTDAQPGITFKVEKNIITITGYDKELVAKLAAQIRRVRPPEPYKGKGIRYVGEVVRKKVGKKAAATSGAK